jgi:hypothetical protein
MADRAELGRTISSEEFSAMSKRAAAETAPAAPPAASDDPGPVDERLGVAEQLRRLGLPTPPTPRLEVGDILGAGATARVYAAQDHDLERPVAIKLLSGGAASPEEIGRFVDEARITASLSHPNVLPVHELEVTSRGQVFFSMKRIDGRSLGAVVTRAELGERQAPLDDLNAVVSVFIGVCQALAYAHKRRIVHQDVKPDNIMLGDFGEVLLVDWGSAVRLDAGPSPRLYGTPLYMSPEQARLDGVDERSDVYCVGASLFHALMLRVPTWCDDIEEFWRRKKAGVVAEPMPAERRQVPAQLIAIALKALAADPAARYPSAAELLDDLRRYQGGLAVSAYRESTWQRWKRWHRRHARAFWSWTAAALVVLGLGAALLGERIEQMAYWGRPTVEAFDEGWQARWMPKNGSFGTDHGRLVSQSPGRNFVVLRDKIDGPTAIEYTGELLPGVAPGDISLLWSGERKLSEDGSTVTELEDSVLAQVGAWYGTLTLLTREHEDRNKATRTETLARGDFVPAVGHPFRVRFEIEDARVRLLLDGREIGAWTDPFPLENGYLALYAEGAGKAFSDLRIYHRELPAKVPATAIGDAAARAREYPLAEKQYARVVRAQGDSRLGREALFRQGLCRWRQGDEGGAMERWAGLAGSEYDDDIELFRLQRDFARDPVAVLADLERLERRASAEMRGRLTVQWGLWIEHLLPTRNAPVIAAYLDFHDHHLRDQRAADHNVAEALDVLGRYDDLLQRFPQERTLISGVYTKRGEYDRVVREFPEQLWARSYAAFLGGLWSEFDPKIGTGLVWDVKRKSGHLDEVLDDPQAPMGARAATLHTAGRFDELMALDAHGLSGREADAVSTIRTMALLEHGCRDADRPEYPNWKVNRALITGDIEAMTALTTDETYRQRAALGAAIAARAAGDRDRFHALLPKNLTPLQLPPHPATACFFAAPLIDGLDTGDFSGFDGWCELIPTRYPYIHAQVLRYVADRIRDRVDDERFLAQPCAVYAKGYLALALGMRADRHGDHAAALAAYRDYLAIGPWARSEEIDGSLGLFASWRVAELQRP